MDGFIYINFSQDKNILTQKIKLWIDNNSCKHHKFRHEKKYETKWITNFYWKKLSDFIPISYCEILASYLTGRQQRVKIITSYSDFSDIDSGLLQDSVVSPILFAFLSMIF